MAADQWIPQPGFSEPGFSEPVGRELGGREPVGRDPVSREATAGDHALPSARERRPPLWQNRREAGLALAERLQAWRDQPGALVIGLPRGGVAVAAALAGALHLPLAPWAVRKLGHPADPEVAIGAIAPGGVVLWDQASLRQLGLSPQQQARLVADQRRELERRQRLFGDPEPVALRDRPLLVVDDGVATGLTVRAALASLRQCQPRQLVLAVPVIDETVAQQLEPAVDGLVALARVRGLRSVGAWYGHFGQLEDARVLALLADHRG
jgi:putative phosphoribosyl transferase